MAELPSGTVTFLFTDLVGSTRLWEQFPDAMQPALARHDELLRSAIEGAGGFVVKTTGDGFHGVFPTARGAIDGAVAIQLALAAEAFDATGPLQVRIGVHTCEAEYRDGDYYGSEVNRAARLMSVANGDQIVVSLATSALVRDGSVELADLGEHRLRDLTNVERVFEVRAPGLATGFAPLRSLDALPSNLPRQATTFVGREAEIESVAALVRSSSLVTLTGVGGVGKTRLALQVAAEVVPHFPDGAWCCEYAPLGDPGAVWDTLATSLRVQAFPGRSLEESVLEYVSAKRMLLVLDNCEHLLDALAQLIDDVARRAPQVSVLATSREGLGVAGERMVAVPSLGVPDDDLDPDDLVHTDAVQLFGDRASAANSGFALNRENASAVGVLCRRLDGIPLAIELAAARARSMSPDDLVARLDQRFKLLTRGSRGAVGRQQTLRSTIDWSYDLLDPVERRALERLSVFAGGCDLAAAEAVLADDELDAFDVDDVLGQLVDKSLVVADHDGGRVRYRMLETIRQYADERLQESRDTDAVRRRHADYYVALAETAGPHLVRREQVEWNATLIRETDNLRAALDWAVEAPSPEHALRLVAPLAVDTAIGDTAQEWAALAVAIPEADADRRFPEVAAWASWGATRTQSFDRAEEFLAMGARAAARLGVSSGPLARARALIVFSRGDFEEARRHSSEWLELSRAAAGAEPLARALVFSGTLLSQTGERDAGIASLDEAIRLSREHGFVVNLAYALTARGEHFPVEEYHRALAMADEAVAITEEIGGYIFATCSAMRAWCRAASGDWSAVLRASPDVAALSLREGHPPDAGLLQASLALTELGHPESAAVAVGAVGDFIPVLAGPGWATDRCAANARALVETLGEQEFATLTARGAALGADGAVAYLRTEAARVLGDEDAS
ncbi:MAG: ATP-binding protein [Acidimicrobiia bacterium]